MQDGRTARGSPTRFGGVGNVSWRESDDQAAPKAILTGTDVVVDTPYSSKNTIFRGRNSQVIFVVSGRQNVPYEKNSQAMRTDQIANIISSMGKTDMI